MLNNIVKDPRVPQTRKLIADIFGKSTMLNGMEIMITRDNTLVIIVFNTTIYTVKLLDLPWLPPIAFNYSELVQFEEDLTVNNVYLLKKMNEIYNHYLGIIQERNIVAEEPVLRGNEEFERCLSLKAADGAEFFKVRGFNISQTFMVPIFTGFPSLNKTDQIGIIIYDIGDGHSLINMKIFKKKINRELNMYFRTINLI